MSIEITTAMARQFAAGIDLLQQQLDSRFRSRVRVETITSAEAIELDQVDGVSMTDIASRHQDTALTDVPHRRRVIQPITSSVADLIDPADARRVFNNPQNAYVQSFAAAANRRIDDHVIAAFFATATTGKGGSGTQAFDTANYQVAAGGGGMSTAKLRTANQKLKAAENPKDGDQNRWYVAYGSEEQADLLADNNVIDADFNTVKALVSGEVSEWLGFEHVLTERVTLRGAERQCAAWVKRSMGLAISLESRASIRPRADKEDAIQVRMESDAGASRLNEKGVVEILCT